MPQGSQSYKLGLAQVAGESRVVLVLDEGPALAINLPGPGGDTPPADIREMLTEWDLWLPRLDDVAARRWPSSTLAESPPAWELPRLGDKLICIGANYFDHIGEMDVPAPPWPYSFVVPPSTTLALSGSPVQIPRGVQSWDWEAEVAVVLSRRLRYASPSEAKQAIALYVPFNDLSARDAGAVKIAFGIDMTMIKAHDRSKVLAPLFTPSQFVADPQALHISCSVNGELKQDFTTATMIFPIAECVAHLSTIMTLEPGDIIATGTGGGVGILRDPPEVLHDGDYVAVEVDGLGRVETMIRGADTL